MSQAAEALNAILDGRSDDADTLLRTVDREELYRIMLAAEQLDAISYNILHNVPRRLVRD